MDAQKLEQLSAYLDGELTAAERADVERLLAGDAEARSLLAELKQVSRLVSSVPRDAAPGNLADLVTARMERESLIGEPSRESSAALTLLRWSRPLTMAACLAIVGTVGWLAWPTLTTGPQKPASVMTESVVRNDSGALPNGKVPSADGKEGAFKDSGDALVAVGSAPIDRKGHDLDAAGESVAMATRTAPGAARERLDSTTGLAVSPTAEQPDAGTPGAALMVRDADDDSAREEALSDFAHAPIETLLAQNRLTNYAIQTADESSFGNSLKVEVSDPEVAVQLASLIQTNMAANFVQELSTIPPQEVVEAGQTFYFARTDSRGAEKRTADEARPTAAFTRDNPPEAGASGEDEAFFCVLNVPREQAVPLLESLNRVVEENSATAEWTSNDARVSPEEVPSAVLQQAALNTAHRVTPNASVWGPPSSRQGLFIAEPDSSAEKVAAATANGEPSKQAVDKSELGGEVKTARRAGNDSEMEFDDEEKVAVAHDPDQRGRALSETDRAEQGKKSQSDGDGPESDYAGSSGTRVGRSVGQPVTASAKKENNQAPTDASCKNPNESSDNLATSKPVQHPGLAGGRQLRGRPTEDEARQNDDSRKLTSAGYVGFSGGGEAGDDRQVSKKAVKTAASRPVEEMITLAISLRTNRALRPAQPTGSTNEIMRSPRVPVGANQAATLRRASSQPTDSIEVGKESGQPASPTTQSTSSKPSDAERDRE